MEWLCDGRKKNRAAALIAVAAAIGVSSGTHAVHHDRWWWMGLGVGVVVGIAIALVARQVRGRRCV